MSYLNTSQALLQQLATVVNENDIAFENSDFDPSNKSLWYAAYFIPATTEALGKTISRQRRSKRDISGECIDTTKRS